jgi:adenylosuccinate lyase
MLKALSPLDGRYEEEIAVLRTYFSEYALMRMRVFVEISYFIALSNILSFKIPSEKYLWNIVRNFNEKDFKKIKTIESRTRHDVKSVEYFLRDRIKKNVQFIHFGLTSEDVNNVAYNMLIQHALKEIIVPNLLTLSRSLKRLASASNVTILSLTHGQSATPTTMKKEILVFAERLERQIVMLKKLNMHGKFGGAVGTYSAHYAAYPHIKWESFGKKFLQSLGLVPLTHTTQINPHDDIAELSHLFCRIDTILIDCVRDIWFYISRGLFTQKIVKGEIGSSTMPHKVNPINFENAEGNLGLSRALFTHFAEKLPISRLQRDLSDSTVMRNIGVAFGHHHLAIASIQKGLLRITINKKDAKTELSNHPEIVLEAIQTILRRHGIKNAYEKIKTLSRKTTISKTIIDEFIDTLNIPVEFKKRLKKE